MRIIFLTQWFDPEPGAIHGLPLARWLTDRGHEVRILTGFPNYPGGRIYPGYRMRWRQRETMGGIEVLRVPLFPSHSRSAGGRIANFTSFALSAAAIGNTLVGGADVVYVYHPPPTIGLAGRWMKATRRMPLVYHIADMWPETVLESGMLGQGTRGRKAAERLLNAWCSWVYRGCDVITVLSAGFKRLLVDRGVPPDKVEVIYNWTSEDVFRPVPRDERLAAALGMQDRFNVLYAGNLGPFQAIDTVVRAAGRLTHLPAIQIVIAGTGQCEPELKELARRSGAVNVRFLGARPFREMPAVNSLADVLLAHLKDLPFFGSTIPHKTQVSLASERPILMAVPGEAAEIVTRAGAGIACPPENEAAMAAAIETLYRMTTEEREKLGRRGREFYLREMSLGVGGQRLERIFQRVVGLGC